MIRTARTTRKSAILVLGAHRSGTSLVTRVLNMLGFHLGRDLLGQHECNITGLWENAALMAWNEAFLSGIGSSWFDYQLLHIRRDSGAFDAAIQSLVEVLREQFGDAGKIAIKDPRICRLVPIYAEALRYLGYEVRALVQHRLPVKTALSLYRRDGLPLASGMRLWLSHMLHVLDDTERWDRLFIDYVDLLQSPEEEIRRIASWLSGPDEQFIVSDMEKITNFVNPLLETVTNSAVEPTLLEHDVNELIAELYSDLCRARDSTHETLFPSLEHWLSCYRDMSKDTSWQNLPMVTIFHSDMHDKPEYVQYLEGLVFNQAGLLIIKDGEECDAADGSWGKRAVSSGHGLMFNRVVREESQSLVRGIVFSRGHDVLIIKRVGCQLAYSFIQKLKTEGENTGRVILFVDAALSSNIELDLAYIAPDACVALYISKYIAARIDPWQCINSEGDAMTQLIAMLACQAKEIECLLIDTNSV